MNIQSVCSKLTGRATADTTRPGGRHANQSRARAANLPSSQFLAERRRAGQARAGRIIKSNGRDFLLAPSLLLCSVCAHNADLIVLAARTDFSLKFCLHAARNPSSASIVFGHFETIPCSAQSRHSASYIFVSRTNASENDIKARRGRRPAKRKVASAWRN